MIYLVELVKGIFLSCGIIVGFMLFIVFIIYKTSKGEEYEADELIEPFEKYLEKVMLYEYFEQITQVKNIISELKSGKVIDDVKQFKIKKDISIQINEKNDTSIFNFKNNYIVVEKIDSLEK